jgi:hypothetical protein
MGAFCSSAKVVSPRLFSKRLSALRYTLFDEELTTVDAICRTKYMELVRRHCTLTTATVLQSVG